MSKYRKNVNHSVEELEYEFYFRFWESRIRDRLDRTCFNLYKKGLLKYQDRGFNYIWEKEKKIIRSKRTLAKHLKHLVDQGLIKRLPTNKGPGRQKRYRFVFDDPFMEKIWNNELSPEDERFLRHYCGELADMYRLHDSLSEKNTISTPEQLAFWLSRLHHEIGGIYLTYLLKAYIGSGFKLHPETLQFEMKMKNAKVDCLALDLLGQYPEIAEKAVEIFHRQLQLKS